VGGKLDGQRDGVNQEQARHFPRGIHQEVRGGTGAPDPEALPRDQEIRSELCAYSPDRTRSQRAAIRLHTEVWYEDMEAFKAFAQLAMPEKGKVIFDLEATFMDTSKTVAVLVKEVS